MLVDVLALGRRCDRLVGLGLVGSAVAGGLVLGEAVDMRAALPDLLDLFPVCLPPPRVQFRCASGASGLRFTTMRASGFGSKFKLLAGC